MYAFLKGQIDEIGIDYLTLDVNGIGFYLYASNKTLSKLNVADTVKMYVHFAVSQDDQRLFGFIDKNEKEIFLKLITVNNIGPKTAIDILSNISYSDLIIAIASGDIKMLTGIRGIGKKSAERLIVELKSDFANKAFSDSPMVLDNVSKTSDNDNISDAIDALCALGFAQNVARNAVLKFANEARNASELIKLALQALGK